MDERADVAIRVGSMRPSQLIARKLGQSRMAVVAAPAYLARRGVPQTPYDLEVHNCIAFNFARHVDEWSFVVDGTHVSLPAHGDVVAGDGEISRCLALAGQGVTRLSLFHIGPDIKAGRLVPILEAYNPRNLAARIPRAGSFPSETRVYRSSQILPLRTFRSGWRVECSARPSAPHFLGRQQVARCPNVRLPCRRRRTCRCRRRRFPYHPGHR
jgi:DNA-binding transcriptional LysR family regulator